MKIILITCKNVIAQIVHGAWIIPVINVWYKWNSYQFQIVKSEIGNVF